MANCNTHIEIHKLPGKTQALRFPKGLSVNFVLLDERKIEDLIVSTIKMSKHIHFYSSENFVDGNWSSFFGWEPISLFAELSTLNVQSLQRELKLKIRKLLFIEDEANKKSEMDGFFQGIQIQLKGYHEKMLKLPEDVNIKEYYISIYARIDQLMVYVIDQIDNTTDTLQLFNDHLFNKQIRNLFGMLTELKLKSKASFQNHINDYPKHSPQYALFLTFLKLFSEAQNEANQFTKRHLDFYYKKILNLEASSAEPDYVHCIVQPQKNLEPFILEKDTILLAGKTDEGLAKYYSTTSNLVVNQAKIHQVFGGFLEKKSTPNQYFFQDFTEQITAGLAWKPFEKHTASQNIGFAFASQLLFLKGGVRKIKINFNDNWINHKYQVLRSNFNFYLTTEKEWLNVNEQISVGLDNKLAIILSADVPPIVPYNPEIHDGVLFDTKLPVLKIVSKEGKMIRETIGSFDLEIEVNNYKDFTLFSEFGEIDHSKTFEAFGPIPKKDASIYFSSNEFFQKKNAVGTFEVTMDDASFNLFDHSQLSTLENGNWQNLGTSNQIFNTSEFKERDLTFGSNPIFNKKSVNGFTRIKFHNHDFDSSNSGVQTYLKTFIAAAKDRDNTNLPYLPVVTEFKFRYTATSANDNTVESYHIHPNGYKKIELKNTLAEIENNGELFIGINNINAGQPLSLLIQVDQGTADPTLETTEVYWDYLSHQNEWIPIDKENFGDETNGLLQSGIVFLKVPDDFQSKGQTIFPDGNFWLRIAVPERTNAVCNLVGLHLQAVKAVLTDYAATKVEFSKHIEPSTISKLLRPKNQIKKIEQPYSSFGGRAKDTDEGFYKRTSERLRHRARAISKWDYETLVLDEFPQVHRVKCLTHFQVKGDIINNTSAGNVTVVPVAS